jgi:phosphoglycolate phosphatase-like HAD superfamily hydrolase
MLEVLEGIRCVALDFDGTLVDSNAVKRRTYDEILGPLGAGPALVSSVLARVEGDRSDVIAEVFRALVAERRVSAEEARRLIPHAIRAYTDACEEAVAGCPERPGVARSLPQLAARYALYVNSDTPEDTLRRIVEHRSWTGFFRGVYGRPRTKPDNLRRIAQQEGVELPRVVMVGDGRRDQDAARAAGCPFIGVASDGNDLADGGIVMVGSLSELCNDAER